MWKRGSASRSSSASVQPHAAVIAETFETRFSCVSIAPLLLPVVPDV
jgi:hypothetical protein